MYCNNAVDSFQIPGVKIYNNLLKKLVIKNGCLSVAVGMRATKEELVRSLSRNIKKLQGATNIYELLYRNDDIHVVDLLPDSQQPFNLQG